MDERQSIVVGKDGMTTGYPRLETDSGTAQMRQAEKHGRGQASNW